MICINLVLRITSSLTPSNMENEVTVHINGQNLKYDGKTSVTKAAQVIAFLSASTIVNPVGQNTPNGSRVTDQPVISLGSLKVSPRQILIESGAKVNSEKIAAFVYYLTKSSALNTCSVQDIKSLFGKAGEPMPRNFARDLKDAVRANYVFESVSGEYELTELGSEAVGKKFVLSNVTRQKSTKTRSKSKGLEVRPEIAEIEISSTETGFPPFHSLNKGQQILWISCVIDNKFKKDELNMKEICFLIDRLKGNVTSGTFTALNDTNVKKGYLKPTKFGFKPTQPGIDRLAEIKTEMSNS